ncbi:hypothetical protein XELAEV_18024509mg [Xenopus laevis]|uniref:Uncharacterized protein n=1 Tax=Xenopus laevis TaxID=8355 RepID=A0A974D0L0_XENLA|nr:hypothetical protein XELAEV_18024509mg [Xenopus laevis]
MINSFPGWKEVPYCKERPTMERTKRFVAQVCRDLHLDFFTPTPYNSQNLPACYGSLIGVNTFPPFFL